MNAITVMGVARHFSHCKTSTDQTRFISSAQGNLVGGGQFSSSSRQRRLRALHAGQICALIDELGDKNP